MSGEYQRVGILSSYCAPNYGAALTAYALYKTVERLGGRPELIQVPYNIWPNHELCRSREFFPSAFLFPRVRMGPSASSERELRQLNERYDLFLTGSDQLWNSRIYDDGSLFFFQDFVADGKRRLSYATSIGGRDFGGGPRSRWEKAMLLRRFDALSVREECARDYLWREHLLKAERMPDPVFLLEPEEYRFLAQEATHRRPEGYILGHFVGNRGLYPQKRGAAEKIAARSGKPFCFLEIGVPVEEYLALLDGCDGVVTDSYHCVCLALILQKPVLALTEGRSAALRFEDLAARYSLQGSIYGEDAQAGREAVFPEGTQWEGMKKLWEGVIQEEKKRAKAWLSLALSGKGQREVWEEKLCAAERLLHQYRSENRILREMVRQLPAPDMGALKDGLQAAGTDEEYLQKLYGMRFYLLIVLTVCRDGFGVWEKLKSLPFGTLLKTESLPPKSSYVAVLDAGAGFCYENASANRIVYRHEREGFPFLEIISEGTCFPEFDGESSVLGDKEYSLGKQGINLAVFDRLSGVWIDSRCLGPESFGMTGEQYAEGYSARLKKEYLRRGVRPVHISRIPSLEVIKASKGAWDMYGQRAWDGVFASTGETLQTLYTARAAAGWMYVCSLGKGEEKLRLCLFRDNPFRGIRDGAFELRTPVIHYELDLGNFRPVLSLEKQSYDGEWISLAAEERVCGKKEVAAIPAEAFSPYVLGYFTDAGREGNWRERIRACGTSKELRRLLARMQSEGVLHLINLKPGGKE